MGAERYEPQELPDEGFERVDPSDAFSPPAQPCECFCLHCGRTFMSSRMWLQRVRGARDGFAGFWMCPTPNCGGKGFTFDIFPTDANHPANAGWVDLGDDEEIDAGEEGDLLDGGGTVEADDLLANDLFDTSREYDPAEPQYQAMEEELAGEEDCEGEEWKFGQPPDVSFHARVEDMPPWRDEAIFDEPDRRPREIDWPDPDDGDSDSGGGGVWA